MNMKLFCCLMLALLGSSVFFLAAPLDAAGQTHSVTVTIVNPNAITYTGEYDVYVPIELSAIATGSNLVNITYRITQFGLILVSDTLYAGPTYFYRINELNSYTLIATAYNDAGDSDTKQVLFIVNAGNPEPTPTPTVTPTPTPTVTPTPTPTPPPPPTIYNYTFTGPFYDDGSNATGNVVSLTLTSVLGNSTVYTLSYPVNFNFSTTSRLIQASWNASVAWNMTRMANFLASEETVSMRLYITKSTSSVAYYSLNVVDFASMTHPYLQVSVTNEASGVSDVFLIERHDLESASAVPFCLSQFQTYTLTVFCDQGSYTQLFTAGNELTVNIPILAGVFPQSVSELPVFDAARLNGTAIGYMFLDSSGLTDWVYFTITHVSGALTFTDYIYNATGNSQTGIWIDAEPDKTYMVTAYASVNGKEYQWIIPLGLASNENPFLGLLDWLGKNTNTLPKVYTGWPGNMSSGQIAQIIGASVVCLFLCIGSFRSAGACCILSWIIFGILLFLGWFGVVTPYTIPQFALSGFIGILVILDEGKQQVREA